MHNDDDPARAALLVRLRALGNGPDEKIDPAHTALELAAVHHPGLNLQRYRHHLEELAGDTREAFAVLRAEGREDDAAARLEALTRALADQSHYEGDRDSYDHPDNADMVRVIDRRLGLPVALSILYIHAGRAQGWDVWGLNFPGHFVIRVDAGAERLIADPFNKGRVLQAADLRNLIKQTMGPGAELSATYYEPVSNRQALIRLQNNVKRRQIEAEDYEEALFTVDVMQALDPQEYRLLLERGVLCARTRRHAEAVTALESYIARAPDDRDRREAALLLQDVRRQLN